MNRVALLSKQIIQNAFRSYSNAGEKYVRSEFKDGVNWITMTHVKTRNSLSMAMMQALIAEINKLRDNKELRTIVLGAEGQIWSAGHNLKELSKEAGRAQHEKVFKLAGDLMNAIIDSPVPVIAKVDGFATAAGCQMVAQCDLAFCSKESLFSTPGVNFGIFCSTPGVALARSVPKSTALKMLFTGQPIKADEALKAGLVSHVCDREQIDEEICKLCDSIKLKSRAVIELGKRFYYKQIDCDVKKAYSMAGEVMVDNLSIVDGAEGIQSFIEKRKPDWKHN